MLVLRDVIVPVDFEPASYYALDYARELAGAFGARLHLLHVLEDTFAMPAGTEGTLSECPQLARRAEQEARERLNDLLTSADRKAGAVTVAAISASPSSAIVAYAQLAQAGAIVMGTHGRVDRPVGSALGSVAEQVVRTAQCPLMVVRRHPHESLTRVEPRSVAETAGA